ncbi:MAG: 3-hydroxyacyl-CoA dehydrogenase family protein [Myxococcota bacterium]|nr:3-hydroxyacyl-CoA dehydrogenase family protein [Myxococcota bacterium]
MPESSFSTVAVFGAGTMGHGIAQVSAMAGYDVRLYDISSDLVDRGLSKIRANLDKGVDRGKVTAEVRDTALARVSGATRLETAAAGADLLIEAIPEKLSLKHDLFGQLSAIAPDAVYGTNTSSISIARIAEAAPDAGRVVGLHFFNPVHIMSLLEIIHHAGTAPSVLADVKAYGADIGKQCIIVRDMPGFATSRLGVCLGMEAIRMVQDGVASPEDIDKAMVLGYRHPVGPLKLTDMVGLDVRMHIGEYLAKELGNPAFEPPVLMRDMVARGELGRKSGRGFYEW